MTFLIQRISGIYLQIFFLIVRFYYHMNVFVFNNAVHLKKINKYEFYIPRCHVMTHVCSCLS